MASASLPKIASSTPAIEEPTILEKTDIYLALLKANGDKEQMELARVNVLDPIFNRLGRQSPKTLPWLYRYEVSVQKALKENNQEVIAKLRAAGITVTE